MDKIEANLRAVAGAAKGGLPNGFAKVGQHVKAQARENFSKLWPDTKYHGAITVNGIKVRSSRTGKTGQSILHIVSDDKRSVKIGTDSKIGLFQELGTKPYIIRPVKKKMLAFVVLVGGKWAWTRAKEVHHPGVRPKKWLEKAAEESKDFVRDTLSNEFWNAIVQPIK